MDTSRKLEILTDEAQYDLACACGSKDQDRRQRSSDGLWVYPATTPRGGNSIILKTLVSNACVNDCRYCPLRASQDIQRCHLPPDDVARIFMDYVRRRNLFGLFLTSGVARNPDHAMDRITAVAELLRNKYRYRGFLHLKIMPGSSPGAIETALSLASAVSLNVEAPKRSAFERLAGNKNFERDIVEPIKLISRLTDRGNRFSRVHQTTQFIVGAADEHDRDIVRATNGLYRNLHLERVYYSAYQRGLGDPNLPGEQAVDRPAGDILTREHRLYQTDFLLRKYKWDVADIPFDDNGNLSLTTDPKQHWADRHPEVFPIRLRTARKFDLLRVPGLGPTLTNRILQTRQAGPIRSLRDIGLRGKNLGESKTLRRHGMKTAKKT